METGKKCSLFFQFFVIQETQRKLLNRECAPWRPRHSLLLVALVSLPAPLRCPGHSTGTPCQRHRCPKHDLSSSGWALGVLKHTHKQNMSMIQLADLPIQNKQNMSAIQLVNQPIQNKETKPLNDTACKPTYEKQTKHVSDTACKPTYWAVQWTWFARVNALCNLSLEKSREVAVSLLGQFLRRRCFMLCITMEVESIIAKQYKCHHCCSCKNYRGKGMEGG